MKIFFLLAAFLLLPSCQSTRVFTGERCQTFFAFDQVQKVINLEKSTCRCTTYKISMEYIGNLGETVTRHPIEYCHEKIGYSPDVNLTLTNFYKDVRDDINSHQKNFSEASSN